MQQIGGSHCPQPSWQGKPRASNNTSHNSSQRQLTHVHVLLIGHNRCSATERPRYWQLSAKTATKQATTHCENKIPRPFFTAQFDDSALWHSAVNAAAAAGSLGSAAAGPSASASAAAETSQGGENWGEAVVAAL